MPNISARGILYAKPYKSIVKRRRPVAYSIMLTTLYKGDSSEDLKYFGTDDGGRRMYCDALLSAEACSKYILANHRIDEILVLGGPHTYDERDTQMPMALKDGQEFYTSDIQQLSKYSILRYRLAQFLDELHIDDQDFKDLLGEDEREAILALIKAYFQQHRDESWKFNRFFDALARDEALQNGLWQAMEEGLPHYLERQKDYQAWAKHYLYEQLKDSNKLELLEGNEKVLVRFLATDGQRDTSLAHKLRAILPTLGTEGDGPGEVDLYLCLHNQDAIDTFTILNVIQHLAMIPGSNVNVIMVATIPTQGEFANTITDASEFYNTATLLAATQAFLSFGKTGLLLEYWAHLGIDNPFIGRVLNAMRIIDVGISLCDIGDIERGIRNLRHEFNYNYDQLGSSPIEGLFSIVLESVKRDFGNLLEYDRDHFIDLVKWTYEKGFWQQALTLVESRAPEDFVDRGIFYYCDSKESADRAIKILGQVYYDLKPYEKYKLDNVSHYFVKFYGRDRCARGKNNYERQKNYAQQRVDELDTNDQKVLRAYTRCTDKDALNNLLYAYYYLGSVRNATNHAEDEDAGVMLLRDEWDVSVRMESIDQVLRFFIKSYENVTEHMEPLQEPVRKITTQDLFAYSRSLRPPRSYGNQNRNRSDNNGDDTGDQSGTSEQGDTKPADND